MSRIEQLIEEIEEFIDSCKQKPFSNNIIMVDKVQLEELLSELRHRTPDEIKKYQRIITNKEAILNDAKEKADAMIAEATARTNELVTNHEIVQQAYIQAQDILDQVSMQEQEILDGAMAQEQDMLEKATNQAQEIIDNAVADANNIRSSAISYTDEMLNNLQVIIGHTLENVQGNVENLLTSMRDSYDIVTTNRNELVVDNPSTSSKASSQAPAEEDVEPEMLENGTEDIDYSE